MDEVNAYRKGFDKGFKEGYLGGYEKGETDGYIKCFNVLNENIVRCKECAHYEQNNCCGKCAMFDTKLAPQDFCSKGIRKDDKNESDTVAD